MNIEEVDKWLKDQYGISYTEMSNEFNGASELLSKKYKEIERLNNIINELEKWLKEEIPNTMDTMKRFALNDVLNKLQELKGESND